MKNPIQVFVGSLDLAAVHSVTQRICMVNEDEKMDMVSSILKALMLSYVSGKYNILNLIKVLFISAIFHTE